MTLPSQIGILCRANLQMAHAKARSAAKDSKLLLVTVAGFALTYLALGYFLFYKGMDFLGRLPGFGTLVTERILYLIYFFFFLMLVFSNAVIGYASLFRSVTTRWLLTLPIDHRAVFGYRFIETLVLSSWGLVFLSAPLLLAYGRLHDAPWSFYLKSIVAYIPFVVVPAGIAAWIVLPIVRFLNKWWVMGIVALAVFLAGRAIVHSASEIPADAVGSSISITFNQILNHTKLSTNPFVPSTWMTDMIMGWSRHYDGGTFDFLLLTSYALMVALLTLTLVSTGFYGTWIRSVRRRAALAVASGTRRGRRPIRFRQRRLSELFFPGIARSTLALVRKDGITFIREPSQWVQVAVVIGLLFLYVLNLKDIGYGYDSPFWRVIISYLNLAVCALALSTLTTRFIFPQFSLEGRRLWILGLAPFSLQKVVLQKFFTGFAGTAVVTLLLMLLSGKMLGLPPIRTAYFMGVIVLMSFTLTALSVGIGTLFPNLRETNPSKIVSGFGGTLCLILSFVYIVLTITCLITPDYKEIAQLRVLSTEDPIPLRFLHSIPVAGLVAATIVSLIVGLPPLFFACKRVKNLEISGNM